MRHVTMKLQVDLESPEFQPILEDLIRKAFYAGYELGIRDLHKLNQKNVSLPISATYQDWRGWGPGGVLPGAKAFRDSVRGAETLKESMKRATDEFFRPESDDGR